MPWMWMSRYGPSRREWDECLWMPRTVLFKSGLDSERDNNISLLSGYNQKDLCRTSHIEIRVMFSENPVFTNLDIVNVIDKKDG